MEQQVISIELDSTLKIDRVSDLHHEWQLILKQADKIEIDASAVTQIDTAALQLLLVLKMTAISEQKDVAFEFPSERFCEAVKLLGLTEIFGLDNQASGLF